MSSRRRLIARTITLTAVSVFAVSSVGSAAFLGSVFTDWTGLTDFYPSAPHLPAYAHPEGADKLNESTGCGDGGDKWDRWFPNCRQLQFGSTSRWNEIKPDVVSELTGRGWIVEWDRERWLRLRNQDKTLCVSYVPRERSEGAGLESQSRFAVVISAFVNDCSGGDVAPP